MGEPQKKKRIDLPKDFDETDRTLAAQLIIEQIVERTADNRDVNGKRFPNYSSSYANSLDFKIAGKSKGDPNLRLSGDMLDSIQLLDNKPGYITIGYNEGTPENDKAAWAETTDNGVARRFLGVSDSELEIIVAKVKTDRPRSLQGLANQEKTAKVAKQVTKSLVDNILKFYTPDNEDG